MVKWCCVLDISEFRQDIFTHGHIVHINPFFWQEVSVGNPIMAALHVIYPLGRSTYVMKMLYVLPYSKNNGQSTVFCNAFLAICLRISLRWHHNGLDSISNHQPHDCLLNLSFGRRSNKTSKLRVTGLCVGNSPMTGEFPAQMASNAENVSIWWRHHVLASLNPF